jgi:hypothetical protein
MHAIKESLDKGEHISVTLGGELPSRPDQGAVQTRRYAVYTGEREDYARALSATDFAMRSDWHGGTRVLTISFERRA